MSSEDISRASSFWDENVSVHDGRTEYVSWLHSPYVNDQCLRQLEFQGQRYSVHGWIQYLKDRFFRDAPASRGISLCCGDGSAERWAVELGLCATVEGFDISRGSLDLAAKLAAEKGLGDKIRYEQADINAIELEPDRYDLVLSGSAVHHIRELEHLFSELRRSARPGAVMFLSEFVGPNQFQWTDRQLELINGVLATLPERHLYDVRLKTGAPKCAVARPTIEHMNQADPSEAIRSADIIPALQADWEILERLDYGGTLCQMLFDGIMNNFAEDRALDRGFLRVIHFLEDVLIRTGAISSDFTFIIAKPRTSGAPALGPGGQSSSPEVLEVTDLREELAEHLRVAGLGAPSSSLDDSILALDREDRDHCQLGSLLLYLERTFQDEEIIPAELFEDPATRRHLEALSQASASSLPPAPPPAAVPVPPSLARRLLSSLRHEGLGPTLGKVLRKISS